MKKLLILTLFILFSTVMFSNTDAHWKIKRHRHYAVENRYKKPLKNKVIDSPKSKLLNFR